MTFHKSLIWQIAIPLGIVAVSLLPLSFAHADETGPANEAVNCETKDTGIEVCEIRNGDCYTLAEYPSPRELGAALDARLYDRQGPVLMPNGTPAYLFAFNVVGTGVNLVFSMEMGADKVCLVSTGTPMVGDPV